MLLALPFHYRYEIEDEVVALRKDLDRDGHEAGAATIAFHFQQRHGVSPAVSMIWWILSQRGFVTPQPHKRPKSSYLRFAAEQPNERWQLDITHWTLSDGTDVAILNPTTKTVNDLPRHPCTMSRDITLVGVAGSNPRPLAPKASADGVR